MAAVRMSAKRVRRIAHVEAKRVIRDTAEDKAQDYASFGNVTSTPSILDLSLVAQGTNFNHRTGAEIQARSLFCRMRTALNPNLLGAAGAGNIFYATIRIMIIMDTGSEGVPLPVLSAANTGIFPGAGPTVPTEAQKNIRMTSRYLVLRDKSFTVHTARPSISWKWRIPLRNRVHYLGLGAAVADQGPNGLYMVTFSSETVNPPVLSADVRFRFQDI